MESGLLGYVKRVERQDGIRHRKCANFTRQRADRKLTGKSNFFKSKKTTKTNKDKKNLKPTKPKKIIKPPKIQKQTLKTSGENHQPLCLSPEPGEENLRRDSRKRKESCRDSAYRQSKS